MPSEFQLITAEEAADLCRVKRSTIYEWARFGHIPTVPLGRGKTAPCVRFDRNAIAEWVKARAKEGRTTRVPDRDNS